MDSVEPQGAVNGQGVKDLSVKAAGLEDARAVPENEIAHLKNASLNGVNGSTHPIPLEKAPPPATDFSLPTPTDSATEPVAPLEPAANAGAPATDAMVVSTTASVAPPTMAPAHELGHSSTTLPPTPSDPAVQPPVSDARSPIAPATEEQAAEIRAHNAVADGAAAASADLAATSDLAQGIGKDSVFTADAQAAPSSAPAPSSENAATAVVAPVETDAMDISKAEDSTSADQVNLPHRSPAPAPAPEPEPASALESDIPPAALEQASEKSSEPAVAPAPSVEESATEAPAPSMETSNPLQVKTEIESAPAPASGLATPTTPLPALTQDTEMKDAAPSPGKLSRARDEDGADEPDAKRMRPSSAGEPAIATTAASVASPANMDSPGSPIPAAGDRDFQSPITEPQLRAIATVIANTKRSTHAIAFAKPVDWVALKIPTYPDIVKQPMDLSTINDKIRQKQYANVQDFVDDFNLIVGNCEKFNGPTHQITQNGYKLRETFDKQMNKVPGADYVEPPPPERKKKISTPRPSGSRRESRAAATPKTPVAASPAAQTFALGPEGMPLIRRDSGAQDGRPRREIHPPAPKDLPYSQRPKKKKYQVELRFCNEVLKELEKPKYAAMATPFKQPVDPVALNIPNYHKVIKKPMDLGTMRKKLDGGMYENAKEFEQDFRLMFQNCYKFNPEGDFVNLMGKQLESEFSAIWQDKDSWVKKRQQDSSLHSPGSTPGLDSDVEEEEEEEEEEDDEEEEEDKKQQIANLKAQMALMNEQLQKLEQAPPKKKKKKATPPASKKKATSKKDSKKSTKDGAKKGSRKSGKKADAPYVSYEQKQDISNRINTLPENRMAQALNIIRDNMPNLKGVQEDELELDIDELSNDVLYKLLQFVRKYAPKPDDEASESRRQSFAPTQASKPKKNKPMGAREQEKRIAELRRLQQGGADLDGTGTVESSDDDDDDDSDEESEED